MTIMLSRYLLKGDREGSDEDGMDVASASTKIEPTTTATSTSGDGVLVSTAIKCRVRRSWF
jgi:hypothetical protein